MRAGIPVILFEGGHFPDDYQRFGLENITQLFYIQRFIVLDC